MKSEVRNGKHVFKLKIVP